MKIKVGGKYKNRNGHLVEIVEELSGESIYPFIDTADCSYTPEGSYLTDHPDHCNNLIEEIHVFDLNKTYVTTFGHQVIILARIPKDTYHILGLYKSNDDWNVATWTEEGIYDVNEPDRPLNIVEVDINQLRTRNGTLVKIYERYPNEIHGAYFSDGEWRSSTWTVEGGFYQTGKEQSCLDISWAPPKNWTAGIEFCAQAGAGVPTVGRALHQPHPAAVGAERVNL